MRVVLTGGGTGGHIYPALALYRVWKERYPDTEFLYIGTERGLESQLVPDHGIPFKAIDIQGLHRSLSLKNIQTVHKFLTSVRRSRKYLKEFQPDVVLGTGGFVCGPVLFGASQLKIPSVIHEQNSVPGLTNKFLARYVDRIALSFEEAGPYFNRQQKKIVMTGNPRAQEVATLADSHSLKEYGLSDKLPTVLIFGGSRGALRINETVLDAYSDLSQEDFQVLFVPGPLYYEGLKQEGRLPENDRFKLVPYVDNMPGLLKRVSLVVARSGATTLAELTALGLPSILIPSPNVTNDHQTKNAKALEQNGASKMLAESELTTDQLVHDIKTIMNNKDLRQAMAHEALVMGIPDAGDRLMAVMMDLIPN